MNCPYCKTVINTYNMPAGNNNMVCLSCNRIINLFVIKKTKVLDIEDEIKVLNTIKEKKGKIKLAK